MQVKRTPKTHDVCIIGSGAAGGTAAKVLTEGGLSVVLLEAGPPIVPERDYKEPRRLPHPSPPPFSPKPPNIRDFAAPEIFHERAGDRAGRAASVAILKS